jgi:DNA-binding Lrp family transcriptional regulator
MAIDELDLRIIAELKEEPRATNRALARALRLSEANIAARISRLEAQGVLRVTPVVDMHALGYHDVAVLGIRVGDRHPDDVAAELIKLPEVMGLNCTFGRYQLVSFTLARDKHHLGELLDRVGTIAGVQDLEACLVLDVLLTRSDVGMLSLFEGLDIPDLPHDHAVLDGLDLGIIKTLQDNGRMSFREAGRRLSTPEATVRSRLARLEQTDAVRLVTVTDSESLNPGKATAWIALRVRGGALDPIAKRLCDVAETGLVFTTIGRFNIIALLMRPSREELLDFVSHTIAPMRGIQQLEVWELVRTYKHDIRISMRCTSAK